MPEYLAPGVYVEEKDTGAKAIEGVSTTTSGMVGVTERGPEGVPTLVIGFSDFRRQFGGLLDRRIYTGANWYLPHAVDGFFTNGGKRLYVVRVLPDAAQRANVELFDRGSTPATATTSAAPVNAGDPSLLVTDATGLSVGSWVKVDDGEATEYVQVHSISTDRFVRVDTALEESHPSPSPVTTAASPSTATTQLAADTEEGSDEITVATATGLTVGTVLQLGTGSKREFVVVANIAAAPVLKLEKAPKLVHATNDDVAIVTGFVGTATLTSAVDPGATILPLTDAGNLAGYDIDKVIKIAGTIPEYRLITSLPVSITLESPLQSLHSADRPLGERAPQVAVEAIDRGGWGNDLYITVEDDDPTLDTFINVINAQQLELKSTVGIEVGTVLEVGYKRATPTVAEVPGELQKVTNVTSTKVDLAAPLAAAVAPGARIRTREFRLSVALRQLNPNTGKLRTIESEGHRHLSMDPRHTRYFAKVIGHIWRNDIDTPRQADGRTQGESDLIRIEDILLNSPLAESTIRLGPDLNTNTLPDGRVVAVPSKLSGGDDAITSITKETYIGVDDLNPNDRRGLFALKNIEEISIVAIPGHTEQEVQQALLDHCELMRYRFAVLDAHSGDRIAEVQEHRSLYDSKYGAFYHPWLMIDDPFPDNPRIGGQIAIPPSGHVIGIYARSDIERGVHKAPANEVVRGIAGLEASLAKEHQDILNPRNINVIRNFRDANRGLRVWGARTLSSDPDWKYINVRRLFIFMEHSIDRGTQWVVFEPNSELLWQRVRRVISSFLRAVWRDGALMGLTPEEAYFVKCDRTTMSQSDIDNGRLIVEIGVAPVKPAEFVIFRIGQWTGGSNPDEG